MSYAMTNDLHDYDPADALDTPEAIEDFLADARQTGDSAYIAQAQAVAARARTRLDFRARENQEADQECF